MIKHSEYTEQKLWTYFPKKMTSGRWVWWDEYYQIDDTTSAEPRHRFIRTTLYSKEEWFMRKLTGRDTPYKPIPPYPVNHGLGY